MRPYKLFFPTYLIFWVSIYRIPTSAVAGRTGSGVRGSSASASAHVAGNAAALEGVNAADPVLANSLAMLSNSSELICANRTGTHYRDVHEEMLGGELLIRPVFRDFRPYQIDIVNIRSLRGNREVKCSRYPVYALPSVGRVRLGNFPSLERDVINRVALFDNIGNGHESALEIAISAKNVNGLNHNIFTNQGVFDRWVGTDYRMTVAEVEVELNTQRDSVYEWNFGLHLNEFPVRI